jgi:hypothetical protein
MQRLKFLGAWVLIQYVDEVNMCKNPKTKKYSDHGESLKTVKVQICNHVCVPTNGVRMHVTYGCEFMVSGDKKSGANNPTTLTACTH